MPLVMLCGTSIPSAKISRKYGGILTLIPSQVPILDSTDSGPLLTAEDRL